MGSPVAKLRERKLDIAMRANQMLAVVGDVVWTAANQAEYEVLMTDLELVSSQISAHQRLLDAEADKHFDDITAPGKGKVALGNEAEIINAVALFLRRGTNVSAEEAMRIRNAMSTTTTTEGGFTVPSIVQATVIEALKAFGGMRQAATIITTDSGNPLSYPGSDGTAEEGEIVAENAGAAGADITFTTVALNPYKYSSKKIALPWELIADSAIDVVSFVMQRLAMRLGRITNKHYTIGTGSGQPFGIAPRSSAGKVGATGQTLTVLLADLQDLLYSVNSGYRQQGASWMMADTSLKVIRKIVDGNGRPIFTPGYEAGITAGVPDTLLGHKIAINDDVPVMAANAKSILFGDLKQYTIRDVNGVDIRRFDDSAFALNGQVGFCGWMRTGGNLLDTAAVKHYANSAT